MRPLNALKQKNKKALVIIAHPDDETLFTGGIIAEYKRWRWTVLCVTDCDERYNKHRRRELKRACALYKRNGSRVSLAMLGIIKRKGGFAKDDVESGIKSFVKSVDAFDVYFTHNSLGDYGHKTHRLVNSAVEDMHLRPLYRFHLPHYKSTAGTSKRKRDDIQGVKLSPGSLKIKKEGIDIYTRGSQKINLSKLKKIVTFAYNSDLEYFMV